VPELKNVETYGKIVALLWGAAVFVAECIVIAERPSSVTHFALYLLGSAWVEVVFLIGVYLLYRIIRFLGPRIILTFRTATFGWHRKTARALSLAIASLLCVLLAVGLTTAVYFLATARVTFWTELTKKAYVQKYASRIDALAYSGRITDAYRLTQAVVKSLGDSSESQLLHRRLSKLQAEYLWSESLGARSSGQAWNPITQRRYFFYLVEAVRINPQNYAAADMLKKQTSQIKQFLKIDATGICRSSGKLANFSGKATSNLEFQLRWQESGSNCDEAESHLERAWEIASIEKILRLSEATRAPLSAWRDPSRSSYR
jgi:hypothetical protein